MNAIKTMISKIPIRENETHHPKYYGANKSQREEYECQKASYWRWSHCGSFQGVLAQRE
jgi:hypothetical protein